MSTPTSHGSRVLSMATGTLASRLTGLFRVLVLAWVLGFGPIADAFNIANTVPNMLFDLVLGGILGATFIPVFVERLALDGERRAWKSISSVITGSIVVLDVYKRQPPPSWRGISSYAPSSAHHSRSRTAASCLLYTSRCV